MEEKNVYRECEDHYEIQLTQGKWSKIDKEDLELIQQYKWFYNSHINYNTGYSITNYHKKSIKMHRLIKKNDLDIKAIELNILSKHILVDHINGDGLDNRKINLRICNHNENICNSKLRKNNTTGYKGVDIKRKKYRSRIQLNKKSIVIGSFDTAIEAARAYDRKAIELFGKYANTNFPRSDYIKII